MILHHKVEAKFDTGLDMALSWVIKGSKSYLTLEQRDVVIARFADKRIY